MTTTTAPTTAVEETSTTHVQLASDDDQTNQPSIMTSTVATHVSRATITAEMSQCDIASSNTADNHHTGDDHYPGYAVIDSDSESNDDNGFGGYAPLPMDFDDDDDDGDDNHVERLLDEQESTTATATATATAAVDDDTDKHEVLFQRLRQRMTAPPLSERQRMLKLAEAQLMGLERDYQRTLAQTRTHPPVDSLPQRSFLYDDSTDDDVEDDDEDHAYVNDENSGDDKTDSQRIGSRYETAHDTTEAAIEQPAVAQSGSATSVAQQPRGKSSHKGSGRSNRRKRGKRRKKKKNSMKKELRGTARIASESAFLAEQQERRRKKLLEEAELELMMLKINNSTTTVNVSSTAVYQTRTIAPPSTKKGSVAAPGSSIKEAMRGFQLPDAPEWAHSDDITEVIAKFYDKYTKPNR